MASILGWLQASPRAGAAQSGLVSKPAADPWDSATGPTQEAVSGVVDGEIRWSDPALARRAAEDGQQAALLAAYREHGVEFAALLGGHYALALIDPTRRCAVLATDRMRTRPLCYARAGAGGLVFGSSADSLRRHPGVRAQLSPQALYDYVYFHMIPGTATIYGDIVKLERASLLHFQDGTLRITRTWMPRFSEQNTRGVDALGSQLQAALREAVVRCRPDAATASFLSGGLDSSTVCGYHRQVAGATTPAYTIGFSAAGYDEMDYARIAARHFGLDLREHYVTPDDIAASMRDIARAYDEPFGNSSAVPTLVCARRAAADGIRVLLAGDGGDEIFAGNERYARQRVFEHYWRLPAAVRTGLVEPLARRLPADGPLPLRKLRSYVEQARVPMPLRLETYNFIQRMTPHALFEPDFLARVDSAHPIATLDQCYAEAPAATLVNRMLYLDWKVTLADNDLRKVGRMCALAGVEVRYPMLDDDLIDFSTQVPAALKLKGRQLRYFYKRALQDFLPRAIIDKTKHGFGLPFGVWLAESPELQSLVYGSLEALKARGILQPAFIERLLVSHRDEHAAYYGNLVWVLAMLELWLVEHGASLD